MLFMLRKLLPIVLVAGVTAGCQSVHTTAGGTVGVERGQMMMVSAQEMEQASRQQYVEMLDEARSEGLLNRNTAQVQRVRGIVSRLTAQVSVFRQDAVRWPWEVNVLSSDELNAWCMAGGKMAIYTGLIDRLKLSDGEIAAVMGHEIAHALREHSREKASKAMATDLGVSVAGALLGMGSLGNDMVGTVGQGDLRAANSREYESEADRMGVELAARAGYDPRAALSLWTKMAAAGSGGPPQWLSTHPSNETRQKELTVYAARVMPLYESARR